MATNSSFIDNVVIGAGISGLLTAYRLSQKGQEVVVVDSGPIGGLVQTVVKAGFMLECGPNVLVAKKELINLINELALDKQIIYPKFDQFEQRIWLDNLAQAVPRSLSAFIKSKMFSSAEKIRIVAALFKKNHNYSLNLSAEDLSLSEYFAELFGERVVRQVIDTALRGIYGGNVESLSLRSLFPQLWKAYQCRMSLFSYMLERKRSAKAHERKMFVLRSGISTLTNELLLRIKEKATLLADSVSSICEQAHSNSTYWKISFNNNQSMIAKRVWIAIPAAQSASILDSLDNILSHKLSMVNYSSIVVVHVRAPKNSCPYPKAFGVLFPRGFDTCATLGCMFNSQLFPHLANTDSDLLTIMYGGTDKSEIVNYPDDYFVQCSQQLLRKSFSLTNFEILNVTRWGQAIPQYLTGHYELENRAREFEEVHKGIILMGSEFGGVGVANRVSYVEKRVAEVIDAV